MEYVSFGDTGLRVSRLGFGAAPIGYLGTEREQVAKVIDVLLDGGVNLIDTAACYPGSEEALGPILADRRDALVLITKAGHGQGEDQPDFKPATIRDSIDRSLQRLGTDRLDVVLLHSCDLETLQDGHALEALAQAKTDGKARFIGYSGDNEAAAWAAAHEAIDVIETSVSIADQHNIDHVLPICQQHGVGVLAKRPIANAAWKDLDQQQGLYQKYAETYTQRLSAMNVTPHELGYYGHADVEWPEIALKFTLAIEGVHCAIVGTTSVTSAQANLAAELKNPLREQVVQRLRDAFAAAQANAGESWQGQT
jgi:aryl-alcohol dehydrogenase-like predicted oxidoreductase